jgi:hypothetical protein
MVATPHGPGEERKRGAASSRGRRTPSPSGRRRGALHYADFRLSQDDAGGTAKAPLSERAQTLIDALAMRDALADTDASPDPRA